MALRTVATELRPRSDKNTRARSPACASSCAAAATRVRPTEPDSAEPHGKPVAAHADAATAAPRALPKASRANPRPEAARNSKHRVRKRKQRVMAAPGGMVRPAQDLACSADEAQTPTPFSDANLCIARAPTGDTSRLETRATASRAMRSSAPSRVAAAPYFRTATRSAGVTRAR